ncbi:MAG: hypothetical protein M3Q44_05995 [bacterium]|nr:hypothetical protein [bacterium]
MIFNHVIYASSAYHHNVTGFDISYPQCNKEYPKDPAFAVIGINGGRPFTDNPCFSHQYAWALEHYAKPAIYMNLSYISPKNREFAFNGPWKCDEANESCLAYNYGYQAAVFAYDNVENIKTKPAMWWLDIETMNTWSDDKELNKLVVQGAIDFLQKENQTVGVYSTNYQWNTIVGDFKPNLPVWAAGAKNKESASQRCQDKYAFTGGSVQMVQYVLNNFDHNYLCSK